jgi:hypothetical protein
MSRAFGVYEIEEKYIKNFGRETRRKEPLGRLRLR